VVSPVQVRLSPLFVLRLVAFVVVLGPPLAALALELLVANPIIAPLLLIAGGVASFSIGASVGASVARRRSEAAGVAVSEAFAGDAQELFVEDPVLIVVPFLVTGAGVALAVGLLWLVVVDYVVGLAIIAALVVLNAVWKRRAPTRPGASAGRDASAQRYTPPS